MGIRVISVIEHERQRDNYDLPATTIKEYYTPEGELLAVNNDALCYGNKASCQAIRRSYFALRNTELKCGCWVSRGRYCDTHSEADYR